MFGVCLCLSFSDTEFAASVARGTVKMRNTEEIQNRALRNRPTEEHTKELLEIIRKRAEEDVNDSNVHFDEVLLRKASVTRPNDPLPSIRVDPSSSPKRQSCPAELENPEKTDDPTGPRYRWRSLSDAPLLELRNRSPRDRRESSPSARSDSSKKGPRAPRLSTNLPPLELERQRFERPNCIPSLHRNGISPKEDINMNIIYDNEEFLAEHDGINAN